MHATLHEFIMSSKPGPVYMINPIALTHSVSHEIDDYIIMINRNESGTMLRTPSGRLPNYIDLDLIFSNSYKNYYAYETIDDAISAVMTGFDSKVRDSQRTLQGYQDILNNLIRGRELLLTR